MNDYDGEAKGVGEWRDQRQRTTTAADCYYEHAKMKKQRKEGTGITKPTSIPQQTT